MEFDLQTFALPDAVTVQASTGGISASGSSEAGTPVTVAGTAVEGYRTDTVTASTMVYNFDGTTSSADSPAHVAVGTSETVTTWYVNDTDPTAAPTQIGSAATTPAENTSVTSPLWLYGGGQASQVSIQAVGAINDFNAGTNGVVLNRTGNNSLGLQGVVGDVTITTANATFKQTLTENNNATIDATLAAAGTDLNIKGAVGEGPTLSAAGAINLGKIDTVQTWQIDKDSNLKYHKLQVSGGLASTVEVTGADATGSYLAITAEEQESVKFATVSGTGSTNDTVAVNGTVLNGAGARGLTIEIEADSIMTGAVANAGTLTANSTVGGTASLDAGSKITLVSGAITAVDKLAKNGAWALGNSVTAAQLGDDTVTFATGSNTVSANSDGTKVGTLTFTSNNTQATVNVAGDHTINANGGATWNLSDSATAVFDSNANATVNASALVVGIDKNGAGKTLAVGANGAADTLAMAQGGSATIENSVVSAVDSLNAGSSWLVRGGTQSSRSVSVTGVTGSELGFTFEKATSSVYGALGTSTANGGVTSIDSLTGNVTLSHGADSVAMNVMGTSWTVAKESGKTVAFDSTGSAASVKAVGSDLSVTAASTDATLNITTTNTTLGGNFNGAGVVAHDSDGKVILQLESDTVTSGISAIKDLNSGATVTGDNQFNVNGIFDIYKSTSNVATSKTQFTLGSGSDITIQNVVDGDNYSVASSNNQAVYYDLTSPVASGGSAKVTVNTAEITVSASSASKVSNAYIVSGKDGTDIVEVGGVKANDTITSTDDKNFTVIYDTSNVTSDTSKPAVLAVNTANVSLTSANLTSEGKSSLKMAVSYTDTMPHVTISSGIANNVTVTVGTGVYHVGNSADVTINDLLGYLYVDNQGNVTGEDSMVAHERQVREYAISSLVSTIADPTVGAYRDFENIYYGQNSIFGGYNHSVAAYADATVSTRSSISSASGVIISGDDSLGSYPNSVTLKSYLPNAINIKHMEGYYTTDKVTLNSAVIDVSSSTNSLVAVGVSTGDGTDTIKTNHTIYGSDRQSALLIGKNAIADNVIVAGNGGNTISNAGGKASLFGGSGNDTIYAGSKGDYVKGGGGADVFYDTNAVEIQDYNFTEGDVIVATKLSTSADISPANLSLSGNKIAIAGGSTITVGASDSYDEATATNAIIANASGGNKTFLVWAGNYDSYLDASEFTKGALMISQLTVTGGENANTGTVNTIVGSGYADTIYAGPNDLVYSGAGNDLISIAAADSAKGERGATVILSEGKNDVYGWVGGFNNEDGSNILQANAASTTFKKKGDVVVAASEGASVNFANLSADSTGAYNFLVGNEKVSFVASNSTVSVNSNSDIANYYKSEKAGAINVGESVDATFSITLGSDNFSNITKLNLQNESRATIFGSSASEEITLGGSADAGAVKSLASGAGNDKIYSGGSGSDSTKAGHHLFFGKYNNTTYSSGRDTINSFSFYRGSDVDADMSHSDLLYLGDIKNYQSVSATANKIEISLGEDTKIVINDAAINPSENKMVRARFLNSDEIYTCKFGVTSGQTSNTFTYDKETNIFFGNSEKNADILQISSNSDLNNVNIWLDDKNNDKNYYYGINTIDAHNLADTKATLVGNSNSNMIYAGGSGMVDTLWGGGGESNTLIGGDGDDTFIYRKDHGYIDGDGIYRSSNDVMVGVGSNDLVWLQDVTLDDLNLEATIDGISTNSVVVTLKDDSKLTVANASSETKFRVSDGQGGWSEFTAVSNGNEHYWK